MAEINWDGGGRFSRRLTATARAGWVAGKILVYLAAGAGAAVGGWCMVSSSAGILTSSDKVLLQVISAPPSPDARKPPGQIDAERDPFASRRAELPPTPEQSLWAERAQALVIFGMGLFVALFSLAGLAAAGSVAAEALGFEGGGGKPEKA